MYQRLMDRSNNTQAKIDFLQKISHEISYLKKKNVIFYHLHLATNKFLKYAITY